MKNRKPLFILIPVALFFAIGGVTMLLWNYVIPSVFGLHEITYLQALGLFLLSKILFGGFRSGNNFSPFGNSRFKEKMMHMTEEERLLFKEAWKSRCNK